MLICVYLYTTLSFRRFIPTVSRIAHALMNLQISKWLSILLCFVLKQCFWPCESSLAKKFILHALTLDMKIPEPTSYIECRKWSYTLLITYLPSHNSFAQAGSIYVTSKSKWWISFKLKVLRKILNSVFNVMRKWQAIYKLWST